MKKAIIYLLAVAILFMSTACITKPKATPEPDDDYNEGGEEISVYALSKYTIVYPERYTEYQMETVYFLRDAIKKLTGIQIPIIADSKPYTENEIILASSKRVTAIEQQVISLDNPMEYIIAVSEGDIILGGNNYYSDLRAVYDFVYNYMGYDDINNRIINSTKHIKGFAKYRYTEPLFTINAVNYEAEPITNARQVRALSDAGFNTVTVDANMYTEKEMNDFTVQCTRFGIYIIMRGVEYVSIYKDCPIIKGHCIVDEPYGEDAYQYYSDLCETYEEAYSGYGWKPYVNFMGQLDVMKEIADNPQYFENVETLAFESAFFGNANISTDNIFREYEVFSHKALSEEKTLWGYIQGDSVDSTNADRMFRWMANAALCFGATGIQYFNYASPTEAQADASNSSRWIADSSNLPSEAYNAAKATNIMIDDMSELYYMYNYKGTYTIGEGEIPDYAVLENPYDGFGDVIEDVEESQGQTYIVGCFEKKNSVFGYAFMIMNTAVPESGEYGSDEGYAIRLKLNAPSALVSIDSEEYILEPDENGYYELVLKNSQAALVMIK